eukprot:scaffold170730_cov45-Attheya_sp.AAC.3
MNDRRNPITTDHIPFVTSRPAIGDNHQLDLTDAWGNVPNNLNGRIEESYHSDRVVVLSRFLHSIGIDRSRTIACDKQTVASVVERAAN